MEGRKGLKLIMETVVGMISILMVLLFLGARSGGETIDAGLLVTMFALLPLFGVSALFFIGRYLEKHGYRREDVKRLHLILEENWDNKEFVRDVQEIIGHHLIVWWLLDMALLWTEDVVGAAISVVAMFLEIFSFIPIFLLIVQWIVAIPLDLYFLASGEESTVPSASYRGRWTPPSAKDLGLWIIKASLFGVGLLVGVYFLGHTVESSSLEIVDELLRLGRNDQLLKNLLLLSAQSAAFGAVEAYLFPRHKKLGFLVLLLVATLGAVVFLELFLRGLEFWGVLSLRDEMVL